MTRPALACALFLLLSSNTAAAGDDGTGSPYFMVLSDEPSAGRLALDATRVDVDIAGVIAHVHVTQVYENQGTRPLEALYVFPGSTRAAVFGMTMTIGDRVIEAQIDEKEQARQLYEQAKQAGKTASLLEQHRPNVFEMSVANVMPGDAITVDLDYTELVVPADATYELVYPTTVGPRYTGESAAPERWMTSPTTAAGETAPWSFEMHVRIATGVPIADVTSPSHEIHPDFPAPNVAELTVEGAEEADRDVIVRYEMLGKTTQTGLLRFEDEQEGFFLLMVQPPLHLRKDDVPPREYIFIVDVSGSMRGAPLDTLKAVMRGLLESLRSDDRFNIMFFASSSRMLAQRSMPVTTRNIGRALRAVAHETGGGGTNLLAAMSRAMQTPAEDGTSRVFVVLTDGYVSVGRRAFRTIRENLGEASLFAVGIGSSVNRHLIEGMARAGQGEPFFVTSTDDNRAARFLHAVESPALTDIEADLDALGAYDVEPPSVPDLFAMRPVVLFGKYQRGARGRIALEGVTGTGVYRREIELEDVQVDPRNMALRYLWARTRIASLGDYQEPSEAANREIVQLGLQYNLLTDLTSFVAVDTRVRAGEAPVAVRQPLVMPRGVPDSAAGDTAMPSVAGAAAPEARLADAGTSTADVGSTEDSGGIGSVLRAIAAAGETAPVLDMHESFDVSALVSDRPSACISSATVGRFRVQLESGADLAFDRRSGHGRKRFRFPTTLRVGLIDPLELRVASRVLSLAPRGKGRREDVAAGLKLALGSSDRFRLGALASLTFATGDPSVTRDELIPHARLLADFALPLGLSLGLNLGLELVEADSDLIVTTATLSRSLALAASSIGWFVGYDGATPLDSSAGEYRMDAGVTWLPLQALQLDLFYGFALNAEPENAVVGLGFAVQI
jgi:Ca-activated chloride channel family protein